MLVVALGLYGMREHERRRHLEAENSTLQVDVAALKTAVDKAQQRGLEGQNHWVSEIRRMELERVLQQQAERRDSSPGVVPPTR
jgi:hypothetical protein